MRTPSTEIASAPALRSSLSRSSMPSPPMLPRTVIAIPCPVTGRQPAPRTDRARGRRSGRRRSSRRDPAPPGASACALRELRDLLAQQVVAGGQVRDELGELGRGQGRQAGHVRLAAELADGEQPEQRGDERDGQPAARPDRALRVEDRRPRQPGPAAGAAPPADPAALRTRVRTRGPVTGRPPRRAMRTGR